MFHSKSPDHILSELKTTENGLSDAEAASRLVKYGPNEFGKGKTRNLLDILIAQFKNYILILLMLAAAVAYFIGHTNDAFAIGIVVILNVFFGMLLEYRADKSMEELKKIAGTRTVVMRNGEKRDIDSQALVPGDIIFLSEGMKVPADLRIIEEHALEINEASLTGESMPVKKNADKLASQTPLAERSCMAYAGTYITQGNARAVVVGTGHSTEFGILEHTLSSVVEEETTLQKSLAELGKAITIASFVIVAILFIAGMIFGKWSPGDLLIYSVSVIVAAVPEGMLTILTIVLAIGVKRMAMEKALVRKIQSVETLGNITFIATDKTGTITEGRMALVKLYDGKLKDFADISGTEKLLSSAYLCNGAYITEEGIIGDETDKAFVIAGIAKGVDVNKLRSITPTLKFRPFNSDRKYMAGTYKISDKEITIIKGAPEVILPRCNKFEDETGKLTPISEYKEDAEAALSKFTEAGMRVLAVAYVEGEATDKSNLVFLGLLALHDPIRREVKHTIKICRAAGIRVLMITGDNLMTAERIGNEIGLTNGSRVALWSELEKLNDAELDSALSEISIIARATPASKLRVVERMVKKGEIVAVTGDGVNDAPALKKAHVGVVMGKTGTEVSKSVADLILMDDNFATLEKAIEYGRVITNNIISFLRFQITTNIALVLLSLPYVMGIKIFDPIQILWINLLIDGPPALTLGLEKPSKSTMKDKPKKRTTFINPHFISTTLNMAFYMTAISLLLFFYYSNSNPVNATAATFTAFVFMQLFNALNSRSKSQPFHSKLLSNPWMVITLLSVAALQISIISIQPLKEFFRIADASLSNVDLIIAIAAGSTVLILGEATKYFRRKHLGFSPSL